MVVLYFLLVIYCIGNVLCEGRDAMTDQDGKEKESGLSSSEYAAIVIITLIGFLLGMFLAPDKYQDGAKDGWNYAQCMLPSANIHYCIIPKGLEGVIPHKTTSGESMSYKIKI
jgi:hypothetical protein